jgi:hypothetical protein
MRAVIDPDRLRAVAELSNAVVRAAAGSVPILLDVEQPLRFYRDWYGYWQLRDDSKRMHCWGVAPHGPIEPTDDPAVALDRIEAHLRAALERFGGAP